MKIAYLIFPILSSVTFVCAQQPIGATTDDGRKILVYPDGTWRLQKQASPEPHSETSEKPANATHFVKATNGSFGVWIDTQKWTQQSASDGDAKLQFYLKSGNGYAMLISETLEVPTGVLANVAIENAKAAMPDVTVAFKEERHVSGKEVLCMKMAGTVRGIPFTYYGYYYGGPEGTVQAITYTGTNLFDKTKPDLEEFLNGLQIGEAH